MSARVRAGIRTEVPTLGAFAFGWTLAVACLLAAGAFARPAGWLLAGLSAAAVVAGAVALARTVWAQVQGARESWPELHFGLLLVGGLYILLGTTGGLTSPFHPLAYAAVSLLIVVHRQRAAAWAWLGATIGLELALGLDAPAQQHGLLALHLTFLVFFAAGNLLVLSTLVARLRRSHDARVHGEIDRMRQAARDFRIGAVADEASVEHAGVETIRAQVCDVLELLRLALRARACVLLWGSGDGRWHVRAAAGDDVELGRAWSGPGLLAPLAADASRLLLDAMSGKRVPPYASATHGVTNLCGVAVREEGVTRGMVCADRSDGIAFAEHDADALQQAASHVTRLIAHERVFAAVERRKREQEQFYRASERLSEALTLDEVHAQTFAALGAIANFDLAVVTDFCARSDTHRVVATRASDCDDRVHHAWVDAASALLEESWKDARSLVALAVKNRHCMPATGARPDGSHQVFGRASKHPLAKSVLVLPLVRGDEVLGTVVLLAAGPGAFTKEARDMLRVISHHVAVGLQNARLYQSMQTRATTDGLTGLTNHRAFQEKLAQQHALAERAGQRYSVILTDIDHFKRVNDTYGHPVGDQVLKRVAAILAGRARKVDTVARYGGEEFVLVLPDTDADGAARVAEELREEVAQAVVASEQGTFSVTLSLGIAEFPRDHTDRLLLIEQADRALYACKHAGRNCVRRVRDCQ